MSPIGCDELQIGHSEAQFEYEDYRAGGELEFLLTSAAAMSAQIVIGSVMAPNVRLHVIA
ncbi:MAG: hypothetical protein KDA92_06775 [Planctomycetales bacterium]|nr:hypothetical protein [Planctomycetales bacterium]